MVTASSFSKAFGEWESALCASSLRVVLEWMLQGKKVDLECIFDFIFVLTLDHLPLVPVSRFL